MNPKTREVEVGETVEMGCGCEIEITKVERGAPIKTQMLNWCDQHDPTLATNEPDDIGRHTDY